MLGDDSYSKLLQRVKERKSSKSSIKKCVYLVKNSRQDMAGWNDGFKKNGPSSQF